jgi:glycosyltransferase involved in cell wall biosynthesis
MLFTVITPNYNSAKFLRNCIESVQRQTCRVEHIVVDGNSTDASLEVIRQYPHVRCISERDTGMYDAVNKGIALAQGDVISYLNADDRYPDGTLAAVERGFEETPAADYVYGATRYIDHKEEALYVYTPPPLPRFILRNIARVPWAQPATFWKRRVFDKVGRFDSALKYIGDYDFIMRTMRQDLTGARVTECLAEFMLHAEALSSVGSAPMLQEYVAMQAQHYDRRPGIFDKVFELYYKIYNFRNFIRKQNLESRG